MSNLLSDKDFIRIGFTTGLSGVRGFFKMVVDDKAEIYFREEMKFFYVCNDGMYIPYFIEEMDETGNQFIIKVEAFDSREEAAFMTNRDVFCRKDFLPDDILHSLMEDPARWNIEGFLLIHDGSGDTIGKVRSLEEYPSGMMAQVISPEGKAFLVPLVEAFIVDILESEEKIVMNLPGGIVPE